MKVRHSFMHSFIRSFIHSFVHYVNCWLTIIFVIFQFSILYFICLFFPWLGYNMVPLHLRNKHTNTMREHEKHEQTSATLACAGVANGERCQTTWTRPGQKVRFHASDVCLPDMPRTTVSGRERSQRL